MTPAEAIAHTVRRMVAAELDRKDGRRLPLHDLVLAVAEKPLIEAVLARHDGNRSRAALTLGISRNTLCKKMLDYGIEAR